MGKILTIAIIALTTMLSVSSCNSSGCTDNQSSLPLAGFYSSSTNEGIALRDIEIGGVGAPNDSILYPAGTEYTQVYLPFRSTTNSTSYYFHYTQAGLDDEAMNDTVTFNYTSTPYFASEECGAMLKFDITDISYSKHLIDSIAITDASITNTDVERIKIYFRTSTP